MCAVRGVCRVPWGRVVRRAAVCACAVSVPCVVCILENRNGAVCDVCVTCGVCVCACVACGVCACDLCVTCVVYGIWCDACVTHVACDV